jgi:predicted PurR-regulated permease PerM
MTGGPRQSSSRPPAAWRRAGETALWGLVIGAALLALVRLAVSLRLVVLPVALAVVLATFLAPPTRWLRAHGWRAGLAALAVLTASVMALGAAFVVIIWPTVDELSDLEINVSRAVDDAQAWIGDSPIPVSSDQVGQGIDGLQDRVRGGVEQISDAALSGVFLAFEVIAGLLLALVVLFFVLKDGPRIWDWLLGLIPSGPRTEVDRIGQSSWHALGGFVRGQTLVALFDAIFIGLALMIIGVPLALPLAVLTFFGAFVPVIGATLTGLLAVVLALVTNGVAAAVAVLLAIIAVQQIEGNLLQPVVVGRATDVHPVAVLLGVTAGGVLAGIIGAMIAAPLVAVSAAVLREARHS